MPSATATGAPLPPSFNAYRILSLPSPLTTAAAAPPPTPAAIKAAYRAALLAHHPDKAAAAATAEAQKRATTIDDINIAYKTLLDPSARAAHDRSLRLHTKTREGAEDEDAEEEWRLGLEAVDLDDLACDDEAGTWWRGCRCGEERGFVVGEAALEEAAAAKGAGSSAEVLVGCVGCSLWIRVGFAVAEEEEEEEG